MRNFAQNKDCPHDAGTKECYDAKWPYEEFGEDTPCQNCVWWDVMFTDDEPLVTVIDTPGTFHATLEDILKLLGR